MNDVFGARTGIFETRSEILSHGIKESSNRRPATSFRQGFSMANQFERCISMLSPSTEEVTI